MSLVKKICFSIILIVSILAFFAGTQNGLHMIINGVAYLIPELEIASVSGGWKNLKMQQLSYRSPGITVDIGEFHLAINFVCLWKQQLCFNYVNLRDINVSLNTSKFSQSTSTIIKESNSASLLIPYNVNLFRIAINNMHIKFNNININIEELYTGLQFYDNNWIVTPTKITGLLVTMPTLSSPKIIKSDLNILKSKYDDKYIQNIIRTKSLLTSLILPLNIKIEDLRVENLCLSKERNLFINHLQLQASIYDQHVKLTMLDIDFSHGLLNASGNIDLNDRWPMSVIINTTMDNALIKDGKIKLIIEGYLFDELEVILNFFGPITAQLVLKIHLAQHGIPLSLSIYSPFIQWPLNGLPQYQARNLSLELKGKTYDYMLAFKTSLSGVSLPLTDITLNAKGNNNRLILSNLRLSTLQGNTDLSAVVNWHHHAISWSSKLSLNGINAAHQWPNWPVKLDGKLTIHGSFLYSGNWQLQIPELDLHGYIKKNLLSIKGSLSINTAGQWQVPQLSLALGCNRLIINGILKDTLALDAILIAPKLNDTLPGLSGQAKGSIKIRGNTNTPQLIMNFSANALRWGKLIVEYIELRGNFYFSDIIHGNLQLHLDRLLQGSLSIDELNIYVTGNEKKHQLKLAIYSNPIVGQLQLNGIFNKQQQYWQGILSQTSIDTPVGAWNSTHAIKIHYKAVSQELIVDPHCWQNANAHICMLHSSITLLASRKISIFLDRLDLAMIKPFLPAETQINGVFTGQININWTKDNIFPQGKAIILGNGVKISKIVQGKNLPIIFEKFELNIFIKNELASFDWLIKIANNGQFNGHIQVKDIKNRRSLSGSININHFSLSLLKPLMPTGKGLDGLVNARLHLGGNMQQPLLYGQLRLDNMIIEDNFIPINITNGQLILFFTGSKSILKGFISTTNNNSQINLTGDADWSHIDTWHACINAQGNQVRINILPIIQLDISPNITFKATPKLFILNGKINIPWARIEVKNMPKSAIVVSSDEILLDNNLLPLTNSDFVNNIPVTLNLKVHIGDDVRLNAFNLKARLNGNLKVVQDKRGLGLNGQIDILSGRFHAYGQDLIVNKGQLLFSGMANQPYLNIEAVRNPDFTEDDVTVGIRVTGLANQPKVEVFSHPIKSKQEALSYLLRGQGLSNSNIDSHIMTTILLDMGIARSWQVMNKIGQVFGVSELELDTQGLGNNSQVVLSGYVAPGLQIKYGIGIFDSLATLTIRYRLMPKLYLEAVSGLNQAINLLYRFEF